MNIVLSFGAALGLLAAPAFTQELPAGSVTAGSITGGPVYNSGPTVTLTPGEVQDAISSEWEEIGTIADLVMSADGQLIGIIADLAGARAFLPVESANLVAADGQDFAFVTDRTLEELQGMAQ